jgi:uncharacterized membrane protein YjfL (UPF0719 family)
MLRHAPRDHLAHNAHIMQRSLQEEGMGRFILTLILMIIYGFVGLAIIMVAYRLVDAFAPFDLEKKLTEENSTATGLFLAGIFIALGLILGSVIMRP